MLSFMYKLYVKEELIKYFFFFLRFIFNYKCLKYFIVFYNDYIKFFVVLNFYSLKKRRSYGL